ncbi:MAG: PEP-CTERM sorting domain-containing protein [Bryobacteraceae bacterium]|nr:PEP-CTERM sorting domain-containing protein [Bryobacteraceae bacterium]
MVFAPSSFGAFIPINTNNAADVALFQAGATVVTFESLTGQNTLTDGTSIAAASQLDNQLKASDGVFFTSGGVTPVAVLDLTGIGTARSGKNVIAPIEINTDLLCASGTSCFLEIFFTGAHSKVGGWFDNGDVQMIIFWTDATSNIVLAPKGNFAGGEDTAKTIDHVTLLFSASGSGGPRTMDDLTFGGAAAAIPEPSTVVPIVGALAALGFFRRRRRRRD